MRRLVACLAIVFTMACSTGQNVDAAQVLRDGGAAMGQLKTVAATLKVTKGTITIQGFTLVDARTSVRLPGDSDTTYRVKQQDVSIGLEVVITSGHVYLHLPFSSFQELSGDSAAAFGHGKATTSTARSRPTTAPSSSRTTTPATSCSSIRRPGFPR